MTPDPSEGVPPGEPLEPRIDPVQEARSTTAALVRLPTEDYGAIEQSPLAAAIKESEAIGNVKARALVQGWAEEDHRRRRRTEEELEEVRRRLGEERDARVRAETRLEELKKERTAQDTMNVVGGAAIGFGLSALYAGSYGLGLGGVLDGLLVTLGLRLWRGHG